MVAANPRHISSPRNTELAGCSSDIDYKRHWQDWLPATAGFYPAPGKRNCREQSAVSWELSLPVDTTAESRSVSHPPALYPAANGLGSQSYTPFISRYEPSVTYRCHCAKTGVHHKVLYPRICLQAYDADVH
jgi:hypothetical protein